MTIVKADQDQLGSIQQLLRTAHFRYADLGQEDLPSLLRRSLTAVGQDNGLLWGFIGVQLETRPTTMPADAPTRAHLRGVALDRRRRPTQDIPALLDVIFTQVQSSEYPVQFLCYGAETWLDVALHAAGFDEVESVQFFQLERLERRVGSLPSPPVHVELMPARPEHLLELAQMDIAAFPPLWHFGRRDLFEMLMRCRVQVAMQQGEIVGYTALCANSQQEVQLARLAVRPDRQGQGIGQVLLNDAIRYAATAYKVLVLNTQTTNTRSQRLYRGYGFKPIGTPVPVLARTVSPAAPAERPGSVQSDRL